MSWIMFMKMLQVRKHLKAKRLEEVESFRKRAQVRRTRVVSHLLFLLLHNISSVFLHLFHFDFFTD